MIEHGIFIADAHITSPDNENHRALLSFLDFYKGKVDALFIVGDLFDFWVGFPNVVFSNYIPLLSKLWEWKECGGKIFYMEGNHDFYMGKYFTQELAAVVCPNGLKLKIDGKSYYIAHGDLVYPKNYRYRLLRFILRSHVSKALFNIIPPFFLWELSKIASRKSRDKRSKDCLFNKNIVMDYAISQWKSGMDIVVLAHFHTEYMEEVMMDGRKHTVTCLGDWADGRSYLSVDKGELLLKKW